MAKKVYRTHPVPGPEYTFKYTPPRNVYNPRGPLVFTRPFSTRPSPRVLERTAPVTPVDALGRELNLTVAQPGDPIPYIFGRTLVTPQIIAATTASGYYGDELVLDLLIGQGPIESIEAIHFGTDVVPPQGYGEYHSGEYIWFENFPPPITAGVTQVPSVMMTAALGESYDALDGLAHVVLKLRPTYGLDIKFMVKGLKLTDPRASPQLAYSTNPALALARIFTDCGYSVNEASLIEAANYCDEDVEGNARWEVNLAAINRRPMREWITTLATYASCFIEVYAGEVFLIPDKVVTSSPLITRSVTAADMVAGSARTDLVGARDVPKEVRVVYRAADGASHSAVAGSGDTGERSILQLPGFQTYSMARRKAFETLNKAKADMRHEHVCFDEGLADAIGDLHDITYAPHGLDSKRMRLVEREEVEPGRFKRSYVEYDQNLYDDSVYSQPSIPDTKLPSPNLVPDGRALGLSESLYTDETGQTYSRLKISWTTTSWPYVSGYVIELAGEQVIMNQLVPHQPTIEGGRLRVQWVHTGPVTQGIKYVATQWIQSTTGAISDVPSTASIIPLGKSRPPGDVPAYTSLGEAGGFIYASWLPAEEITGDLRGYILKLLPAADHTGTAADWTHANAQTISDRHDATSILFPGPAAGDYYLCIRAVDNAANESENSLCGLLGVTTDTWSTNFDTVIESETTNMHVYTIDGSGAAGGRWAVTSTGETWAQRFGDTSPLATWGDAVTQSPLERWGGDLATDSSLTTAAWDKGSSSEGTWTFATQSVTLFGGTQANAI